ncbi:MAG: class I SAM-dependent methyltransferase [Leptospiraceae bacterium]|nr:class I SAM-dependent methyltransferase [Leptospiraceae bacterium]
MIVSYSSYAPWKDDNEFIKTYEQIKGNTLVDIYRCYELWSLLRKHSHLKGDVLEVGVWRGGTGCLMAKAVQHENCSIYLADTFSGVVKPSVKDTTYKGGEHADTSEETVKSLIKTMELNRVHILKGVYPDDFSLHTVGVSLKLCHIDVDTYESAKHIFEDVWNIIVPGGMVVFDDYGFWGCEGVTNLCNEMNLLDSTFIHNLNGHAIFIKR